MKITFNVSRKFVVNGKEYRSLEEMPEELREAFRKAAGKGLAGIASNAAAKSSGFSVSFGGDAGTDAMAGEERKLRADVKGMLDEAGIPAPPGLTGPVPGIPRAEAAPVAGRPLAPESPPSRRILVVASWLAAGLLLLLYLLDRFVGP